MLVFTKSIPKLMKVLHLYEWNQTLIICHTLNAACVPAGIPQSFTGSVCSPREELSGKNGCCSAHMEAEGVKVHENCIFLSAHLNVGCSHCSSGFIPTKATLSAAVDSLSSLLALLVQHNVTLFSPDLQDLTRFSRTWRKRWVQHCTCSHSALF